MRGCTRYLVMLAVACLFVAHSPLRSNDIAVSSIMLTGANVSAGVNNAANFALVQFNLSWDNSWRFTTGPANWDAAWVFVKFRVGASDPTFTGVSSSTTTVTVSNTASLRVGMPVRVTSGTGAFATNTVISSITNSTQFVVSATPTTPLSNASIECLRIWEHARLNNNGHTVPESATIDAGLQTPSSAFDAATNPALGVFIYRRTAGAGNNTFNNVQLRWNYGRNGVNDNAMVSIRVFAVEMVYVPQGTFAVGDGTVNASWFTLTTINTGTATTPPAGTGSLGGQAGGYPTGQTAPSNASWPNGFNAFYCMKYEASQGQYRDFLNTLAYDQQKNRAENAPTSVPGTAVLITNNSFRSGLDYMTSGNATTLQPAVIACNLSGDANYNASDDGEWVALNQVSWSDGCAFLDWAGLRLMTEMEFEKACRGPLAAVTNEFAWGTATRAITHTISSSGTNAESIATNYSTVAGTGNGNLANGSSSPFRVGIYAANSLNTGRQTSGASYWGVMDMSGNVYEPVVVLASGGGTYTGLHGNGLLLADGAADVDFWPGINGNNAGTDNTAFAGVTGVTGTSGSGTRGGNSSFSYAVSYRMTSNATTRSQGRGCRGVRTAP